MIARPSPALALAAEPVGPRLLAARAGAIVSADAEAAAARAGCSPAPTRPWSPDGTQIAFVRDGDLWLANDDGSGSGGRSHRLRTRRSPSRRGRRAAARSPTRRTSPTARRRPAATPAVRRERPARRRRVVEPRVLARRQTARLRLDRSGSPRSTSPAPTAPAPGSSDPVDTTQPQPRDVNRPRLGRPPAARLAYAEAPTTARARSSSTTARRRRRSRRRASSTTTRCGRRRAAARLVAGRRPHARRSCVADADGSGAVDRGAGTPLDWQRVPLGRPQYPDLVQRPPSGLVVSTRERPVAARLHVPRRQPRPRASSGSTAAARPARR